MDQSAVIPGTKLYRDVKSLYLSAFPEEERRPFEILWVLSVIKSPVLLRAYRENGTFCGFTLTVDSDPYLYINFIAVSPSNRSHGCGTLILDELRQEFPDRAMLVEVEAPVDGSPNREQRERRIRFYERNGFVQLDRSITGRGVSYILLSTAHEFDREAYQRIFPHLSFGVKSGIKRFLARLKP